MIAVVSLLLALPGTALAGPAHQAAEGGASADEEPGAIDAVSDRGGDRIINGADATADDYPMTGGIILDADITTQWGDWEMRSFMCSSTLIAPDVVLLAAHCIDEYALHYGYGEVRSSEIRWTRQADLTAHDGTSQTKAEWPSDAVPVWDQVMHPDWSMEGLDIGLSENFDIALLFLDEPVLDVEHAYLPLPAEVDQIALDQEVTVVGWGQQIATDMWEQPPAGSYGIKQMGTSYISELAAYEMQVGKLETDVRKCHGDSGGPTFLEVETDLEVSTRLIGVTSHAYDESDCNETGGVDTRVDYYLDWIDQEMRSRCEDGSRAWCEEEGIVPPPEPEEIAEVEGEEEEKKGIFGCSVVGGGGMGAWVVVLGVMGVVRRRRGVRG